MNLVNQKNLEDLIADHSTGYNDSFEKMNEWNSAILDNSWKENNSDEAEYLLTCFYALLEDAEIMDGPKVDPNWTLERMRKELTRNWMIVFSAIMDSRYFGIIGADDRTIRLSRLRPSRNPTFTGINLDFYEAR